MITAAPFGDIMQKQGDVKFIPQVNLMHRQRRHRRDLRQAAGFDPVQNTHGKDSMLIHRVTVIHIKLHHRDDAAEIRQKFPQKPRIIHQAQHPFWILSAGHHIDEHLVMLGVFAESRIDPAQIGVQFAQRMGVDIKAVLLGNLKHLDHQFRMIFEFKIRRNVEPPRFHDKRFGRLPPPPKR